MELQALEGKDVKDLLLNVGSGGGAAAAAPAAGGAGGDAAPEAAKEEEKVEGTYTIRMAKSWHRCSNMISRQGGVRRGYGFRSLRLESHVFPACSYECITTISGSQQCWDGQAASIDEQSECNLKKHLQFLLV